MQLLSYLNNVQQLNTLQKGGTGGIYCRNLKETYRKTEAGSEIPKRITVESDPIPGNKLGDFLLIIKEYVVCLDIWFEEDQFTAQLAFHYDHTSGGSNGYRSNINITGKVDDDWTTFKTEIR